MMIIYSRHQTLSLQIDVFFFPQRISKLHRNIFLYPSHFFMLLNLPLVAKRKAVVCINKVTMQTTKTWKLISMCGILYVYPFIFVPPPMSRINKTLCSSKTNENMHRESFFSLAKLSPDEKKSSLDKRNFLASFVDVNVRCHARLKKFMLF